VNDYGSLEVTWFCLISVLWIGYFVLEGFDFGVGLLLRSVGRTPAERRDVMHSIGPVWDANEVWLIVAGGATFAAFPDWYATLFSGFYLPLLLIVVALLARPLAFELWGQDERPGWRSACEWALILGSAVPAFVWGVAFANVVHGVPVDGQREFTGSLLDLLRPYALLGGLTTLLLCAAHGALFLTLRTRGDVLARSRRLAPPLAGAAALSLAAFVTWTLADTGDGAVTATLGSAAVVCGFAAAWLARQQRIGAFAASAGAISLLFAALFTDLFPRVLPSTTSPAYDLTIGNSASGSYTLKVLTVVAALLLPLILTFQAYAYWVFRGRVGPRDPVT
jgi:cytochrome bd ubiquinol oxidase subunit II